jgi:hypothetical protein
VGRNVAPHAVTQRFLRDELTSRGLDSRIADASVVAHELVGNAHQYGGGASLVSLSLLPSGLVLEVTDHGDLSTSLRAATLLGAVRGPARRRAGSGTSPGAGLKVVSLLSQEWGVRTTPSAKVVWARLHEEDELVGPALAHAR